MQTARETALFGRNSRSPGSGRVPITTSERHLKPLKVIFFANTEWYLYNFRLAFARFLRDRGFEVVMFSPEGPYGRLLEAEGFRWITLRMDRLSVHPIRELSVLRQISAVYAAEKPDIVHHFTIKCVVYGSFIAWWHGIRNRVNAIEGMGYVFLSNEVRALALRPIVRLLMRWMVRGKKARVIFHNHEDVLAFGAGSTTGSENVRIILGAGIDTTMFQPAPGDASDGATRVLFAGRLLWDKGVKEYVEAARQLRAAGLKMRFLVAGSPDAGNPASVSMRDVESWQADGSIEYLGHVADMPALLRNIDIMVLPSYREGAPRSLIEAAAAGKAIVATDVPGCKDVVEHGSTGLLVPVREVPPLVEAIRFLHEHPDERRRFGRRGREKALNQFDELLVFEQTYAVYQELLAPALPA